MTQRVTSFDVGATERPDESRDPFLGRVIDGRFTIESVLGRGGMGVVYRAHQASLERSVALKLMTGVPPERAAEFQTRFFIEAATAAKLKHPNTITVFDYGSSVIDGEKLFYITMELLDGVTLSKMLAQGRALAPLRAIHIALQVCRSLREAHLAGVVHRDLKPGNVMIVKQDEADDVDADFVKVLDFGLAKTRGGEAGRPLEGITKAGTFMGSPRYVAPEQIEGRVVDQRADIYSFGCVLFRMLSGRVPYDGQQPVEIMLKHLRAPVPAMDVPGLPLALERLVADCLAKDPASRPASMDEVAHRLKLARAELGGVGSGIVVLSDERRASLLEEARAAPEGGAASAAMAPPRSGADKPVRAPGGEVSGGAARKVPRSDGMGRRLDTTIAAGPTEQEERPAHRPPGPVEPKPGSDKSDTGWVLGGSAAADDSTRPTRVLRGMTVGALPKPWAAIGSGVVLGLIIFTGLVGWRLGWADALRARVDSGAQGGRGEAAAVSSSSIEQQGGRGPLAQRARLRVVTTPPGADVLELVNGLPRLIGITPLTVEWDVKRAPQRREFVFRREGHEPSRATVEPPRLGSKDPVERPVWIDVSAALRPASPAALDDAVGARVP